MAVAYWSARAASAVELPPALNIVAYDDELRRAAMTAGIRTLNPSPSECDYDTATPTTRLRITWLVPGRVQLRRSEPELEILTRTSR